MNKESFKKGGGKLAIISFVFIVASLLVLTQAFPLPRLATNEQGETYIAWEGAKIVSATQNTTIGATASGMLEIFFINHSAAPTTAYAGTAHNGSVGSAAFESWCNASMDPDGTGTTYYAYTIANGFSLTVKWGTAFDVVVMYRGNATNAANATMYNAENCRVKLNMTNGLSGGNVVDLTMTNAIAHNGTGITNGFIWLNAYANNAGAGYLLQKGGTCTIVIKLEFNY